MSLNKKDAILPFPDRIHAGRLLGKSLQSFADRKDIIVLALPRGGVPIGYEVAKYLNAPLDLLLVRKLGVPGHKELAMGAIVLGGERVLNHDVISMYNISSETIDHVVADEEKELRRRYRAYRDELPTPDLNNRCVILVDDGIATGATMRAAVAALRNAGPSNFVVAIPVGAKETLDLLSKEVDQVICLATPDIFLSIGQWYIDFKQVSDDEVRALLKSISQAKAKEA